MLIHSFEVSFCVKVLTICLARRNKEPTLLLVQFAGTPCKSWSRNTARFPSLDALERAGADLIAKIIHCLSSLMLFFLLHAKRSPSPLALGSKAVVAADDDLQVIEDLAVAFSDGFGAS